MNARFCNLYRDSSAGKLRTEKLCKMLNWQKDLKLEGDGVTRTRETRETCHFYLSMLKIFYGFVRDLFEFYISFF